MVGEYDRSLSFTTITKFRSSLDAMLFNASQAIPPVSAPSPTTTTTVRFSSPFSLKPRAIPSAQESDVDACEFSITSCALSDRFG